MPLTKLLLLSLVSFSVNTLALASPLVYVSNTSQLGTVDLFTGAYDQIGADFPDPSQGLGSASNASLLSLGFSGNVNSINPVTGVMTRVGPSGLSACLTLASCTGNPVNVLASFQGQTYVTDLQNRLYGVNTATGTAKSIGLTGIPALPFVPLSENADGTINVYDEAFFEANGKLYATFDAGRIDLSTGEITPVVNGMLYQIDPATAKATAVGATAFGLGAAVEVNGTTYAFLNATHQIATLDLATGQTIVTGEFDEGAGIISAAVATPEPATAAIVGLGFSGLVALGWIRRRTQS